MNDDSRDPAIPPISGTDPDQSVPEPASDPDTIADATPPDPDPANLRPQAPMSYQWETLTELMERASHFSWRTIRPDQTLTPSAAAVVLGVLRLLGGLPDRVLSHFYEIMSAMRGCDISYMRPILYRDEIFETAQETATELYYAGNGLDPLEWPHKRVQLPNGFTFWANTETHWLKSTFTMAIRAIFFEMIPLDSVKEPEGYLAGPALLRTVDGVPNIDYRVLYQICDQVKFQINKSIPIHFSHYFHHIQQAIESAVVLGLINPETGLRTLDPIYVSRHW